MALSALASAVLVVAACGEGRPGPGELAVERITRGDTVLVRTLAGIV